MRKGQAALEFLMTYGWAILVVLAAIAALAYFGVLSPDRFLPSKCTLSGGFSCTQYKIEADPTNGLVQFEVQNNLGVDAKNFTITVDMADCGGPSGVGGDVVTNSTGIGNGKKTGLLTFTCNDPLTSNDKFKGDVVIDYVRAGEDVAHKAAGSIAGSAE